MPLRRFTELEREYRAISARIAKARGVAAIAVLVEHRTKIVVEARKIVNDLDVPDPRLLP
jgi:hypothetical protein